MDVYNTPNTTYGRQSLTLNFGFVISFHGSSSLLMCRDPFFHSWSRLSSVHWTVGGHETPPAVRYNYQTMHPRHHFVRFFFQPVYCTQDPRKSLPSALVTISSTTLVCISNTPMIFTYHIETTGPSVSSPEEWLQNIFKQPSRVLSSNDWISPL